MIPQTVEPGFCGPRAACPCSEVWSFPSEESAADPLEAVDQSRYRVLGWVVHEQMYVVDLAMHLDPLGLDAGTEPKASPGAAIDFF